MCRNIGWKFYLCFVVPGTLAGFMILFFFPNTRGLPLEDIAAIFGVCSIQSRSWK